MKINLKSSIFISIFSIVLIASGFLFVNNKNISVAATIQDPPGQLVHHLFNISGAPSAKGVAFSPDGKEIWTTLLLNKKRGITIFDAGTGKKIQDINLNNGGGVEIVFSSDGTRAYASQMETAKVFEIDVQTKKITRVFKTGGVWTKILELSADGKTIYAANWSSNNVSQIDLATGKLVRLIPTVTTPRGVYVTKDNKTLYVAGFDKGEIQKIDLTTYKGKVIYKSGGAMRHFAVDEDKNVLYISDMGRASIMKLDLATNKVTKFAKTDINPNTIALSPDKKILFVSCRGTNFSATNYYVPGPDWGSVLLFDTETGKMLDAIVGGNQPTALAVSKDGTNLIFSDFLDSRLEVFLIPSYETLKNGNGGRSIIYKNYLRKNNKIAKK